MLKKRWPENESKPINNFLDYQNSLADLKGPNVNIVCTIDDVWGDFLGPQHGTTPATVLANKK